jgi:hypothetical protein
MFIKKTDYAGLELNFFSPPRTHEPQVGAPRLEPGLFAEE